MIFMTDTAIYPASAAPAIAFAAEFLSNHGLTITHTPEEATHYLCTVPTPKDTICPAGVTFIGGNLAHLANVPKLDLLQDMHYLAKNAAITAHCAMRLGANALTDTFSDLPVLVIGWGRIGKCLAAQLKAAGCRVSVAARKGQDRAILEALGYSAVPMATLHQHAKNCQLLYNTVPAPVLDTTGLSCVAIDLASVPGFAGDHVIYARGLPGKMVPKAAGRLMGETIAQLLKEGKV